MVCGGSGGGAPEAGKSDSSMGQHWLPSGPDVSTLWQFMPCAGILRTAAEGDLRDKVLSHIIQLDNL